MTNPIGDYPLFLQYRGITKVKEKIVKTVLNKVFYAILTCNTYLLIILRLNKIAEQVIEEPN